MFKKVEIVAVCYERRYSILFGNDNYTNKFDLLTQGLKEKLLMKNFLHCT